jgi:hypothetical protein
MTIPCELHRIQLTRRTQPTLTFSDFLFGYLKNRLKGQQFEFADEFLSGVRKILDEISVDILEAIFRECINRLKRWIATNGKYMS